MRNYVIPAAIAVIFAFGAIPEAKADCAADIKKLESQAVAYEQNKGIGAAVERILGKAKAALAAGDMKRCKKLVKKAAAKASEA